MAVPATLPVNARGLRAGGMALGMMLVLAAALTLGASAPDPDLRLVAAPTGTPIRHSLPAVVTGSTSWGLRDTLTTGPATISLTSLGTKPLVPLTGDWDGNGSKTPGTFEGGFFKLRNSNATPIDTTIQFGDSRGFPVAGDFDGNGTDDLAVFRNGLWQIRYLGAGAPADASFTFGSGAWPSTWPVVGNWDGTGADGIGTFTLATGTWNLRNTASAGAADLGPFVFWGTSGSYPVAGDWDADGTDTVGYKKGTTWSLSNTPGGGPVAVTFDFGLANDFPLTWMKAGPTLTGVEGTALSYTTNTAATAVSSTITVSDPDRTTLVGATVTIGSGYQSGQDVLSFVNQLGITGNFVAGTGTLTLSGTAPLADYQTALRAVQFSSSSFNTTTRTVTFQVDDGSTLDNLSNPASRDISIVLPPAAVTVTKSEPTPGAGTTVIAGQSTITYRFSVANTGGLASGAFTITDAVPTGTTLVGGSQTCPTGLNAGSTPSCTLSTGPPLTWTFSSIPGQTTYSDFGFQVTVDANAADASTITNQASFTNVNTPGCVPATCTTNSVTNTVNTPPSVSTVNPANGATDVPANSTVVVTFSEPVLVTASAFTLECPAGTPKAFAVSPSTPPAATVFTLTPTTPFASFASCTLTVVATQVTDAGGANMTANFVSSFQVAATPTTVPHSYSGAVGNTLFGVGTTPAQPSTSTTGSVLDGATNGGAGTLSAVTAGNPTATANGGSVTMNSDGTFTYTPPASFTGNDTFTYTVTNTFHTASNTVTITVADKVWYVDNSLGAAGDGRSTSPFNSLTPLNGAGGAGDVDAGGEFIFVKTGSGNYAGGLILESNQRLIGQPESLVVGVQTLWTGTGTNPTITNTGGAGITLASGTTIRRVSVANTSGDGITGTSITTADIGPNLSVSGSTGVGFNLTGNGIGNITMAGSITHASGAARSISIANRQGGTVTMSGAISDTAGGIALATNTAMINFTGGMNVASGGNTAFSATGGGTVSVTGTNILSNGATALNVDGVTIGAGGLIFQSIDSNGGASGIVLNNTGSTGGLTVAGTGGANSGGTIQNKSGAGISLINVGGVVSLTNIATSAVAGTDVFVSGGAANVTYTGTINSSGGRSVEVTGKTGGTALFSGNITDGGTGINLTSNAGTVINFTGALALSTGSSTAFNATGSGTVTATGSPNTITTTTGTALNVANTTIGAGGLTFRSISAGNAVSGPTNGIVLNSTGSGALVVAGNGGNCTLVDPTCTGGTIQNTTGVGVSLTNTTGVSLTRMRILNTGSHGVAGTGVSSLTFANGINQGAGDGDDEHAFSFGTLNQTNLTGTLNITNSVVRKFVENGLIVRNTSGALTVNITNSTFQDNNDEDATPGSPDFGANGAIIEGSGSAAIILNVSGSTFDEIDSNAIQYEAEGSGTNDVNIIGNTFSHPSANTNFEVGGGVVLITDTNTFANPAELTFDVQGNYFNLISGGGVIVVGEGNADGRIGGDLAPNPSGPGGANQGNTFKQAASSNGCAEDAIRLDDDGNQNAGQAPVTTWRVLVKNNSIDAHNGADVVGDLCLGHSGDQGIVVFVRDSASTFHGTITNNTVTDPLNQGLRVFVADRDNADGISDGPNVFLNVTNNSFANVTNADGISMSVDDLADLCANITANAVDGNIFLDRRVAMTTFRVPQASTAAISTANGGAPVTLGPQPLTFNTACSVSLPSNP